MKFLVVSCIISFSLFSFYLASHVELLSDRDCEYTLSDGFRVNFANFRRGTDYVYLENRFTYRANFCGPLVKGCSNSQAPAALLVRSDVCFSLSTHWEAKLEYIDAADQSKGLKMSFPTGEQCYLGVRGYQLMYYFKCDNTREIELDKVHRIQACNYEFYFNTKYACPHNFIWPSSSISSKRVLFYLVILFSVYCIGFSYLNYRRNPEDGIMKSFPHREFWRTFCENVYLGMKVITRKLKERLTRKVSDYESF